MRRIVQSLPFVGAVDLAHPGCVVAEIVVVHGPFSTYLVRRAKLTRKLGAEISKMHFSGEMIEVLLEDLNR